MSNVQKNKTLLLLPAISWLFLYIWGLVITNFALVPWDTSISLPMSGTWQSNINYFFDTWPGSHLLSITIVSISICFFLVRNNQNEKDFISLVVEFSFTNFLFICLLLPVLISTGMLFNLWFKPIGSEIMKGYHQTWPYILSSTIMLCLLLFTQWAGIPTRFYNYQKK